MGFIKKPKGLYESENCKYIQWALATTIAFVPKNAAVQINLLLYKNAKNWSVRKSFFYTSFLTQPVLDIC